MTNILRNHIWIFSQIIVTKLYSYNLILLNPFWSAPAEFGTLLFNSHLVSPQLLSSRICPWMSVHSGTSSWLSERIINGWMRPAFIVIIEWLFYLHGSIIKVPEWTDIQRKIREERSWGETRWELKRSVPNSGGADH